MLFDVTQLVCVSKSVMLPMDWILSHYHEASTFEVFVLPPQQDLLKAKGKLQWVKNEFIYCVLHFCAKRKH